MQKLLFLVVAGSLGIGMLLPDGSDKKASPAPVAEANPDEIRVPREANGHYYVHGQVNGEFVQFLVDTGASAVALTLEDARRAGVPFSEESFVHIGDGASGPVHGQMVTLNSVSLDDREMMDVEGAVVEGLGVSLLGQAYLSQLDEVAISGGEMVLR